MILYVEDDADYRLVFRTALREEFSSIRYLEVTNGVECLELLARSTEYPQLIVVDINMPIMNGYELIRKLRTNEAYKDISIVVLTTANTEAAPLALRMGADKFYTKPAEITGLHQLIREMVSEFVK